MSCRKRIIITHLYEKYVLLLPRIKLSNWPSKFTSNGKRGRYHRPQYIYFKTLPIFPTKILKNVIFHSEHNFQQAWQKHMHLHNIRVQFFRTKINVDNSKEFWNVDLTKILYLIIDFMIYPLPAWTCNGLFVSPVRMRAVRFFLLPCYYLSQGEVYK